MLEYDDVKFAAASRNLPGKFTDSPEQSQLFQQPRRDSTADIAHDDGLARSNSKYVGRIHTHICTTDDDCLYIWERRRE